MRVKRLRLNVFSNGIAEFANGVVGVCIWLMIRQKVWGQLQLRSNRKHQTIATYYQDIKLKFTIDNTK